MDKNKGAFAFADVASDFFSVPTDIADEVKDIVLNLEGDSDFFAEFHESVYFCFAGTANNCPDSTRRDTGIPSGFLDTHCQVVFLVKIPAVIVDPTQFDVLSLNNLVTELYKL